MHSSRRLRLVLALGLATPTVLFPTSSRLLAQTVNGTLQGTVTDAGGAAVPKASVTVRNTGTGATRTLVADDQGRYLAPNLQPGQYEVVVEAPTFSRKVFSGITLNVGDSKTLDTPLTAGAVTDTVDVVATESTIQLSSSSNSTVVDNKQVVELPLASRQFYSLALLSPAAFQPAQNSTLGFRGGINIAGAAETTNQFTYNGIYNDDQGVAQPSYRPSVETIQEFRLLTGVYSAEYGRMSGGQVVIISKSGTNAFHGSGYEFIRNEYTDAKPYFTASGARTPSFKQHTFGGTLGGPIWKDRTFFFGGYEGQRIRRAVTAIATVPTQDMINGIFNIGKTLYNPNTGAALTPVTAGTTSYNLATALSGAGSTAAPIAFGTASAANAQLILKLGFPTPTYATTAGAAPASNYNFQETRTENMNEYTIRVDHKLTNKDSLMASFNIFKDPSFEPSNSLCSSYIVPKFGCYVNQISTLWQVTYDRILTPNLVNNLRIGYQRLQQPRVTEDNTAIGTAYPGLPGGPYFTQPNFANNLGLPNTAISGYATIGGATNLPQNRFDNHYQVADTLTWVHGAHAFKFGVDLLLVKTVNQSTASGRGAFVVNDASISGQNGNGHLGSTGDSVADFVLGLSYSSAITPTAPSIYENFNSQDAFILDDWKIKSNLTLNLGVRYEIDSPIYAPDDRIANFDLASGKYIQAGGSQFHHLYNFDYNNVAPRIGFSWQPFHDDKTVVKGAGGIFYTTPLVYNQFLGAGSSFPFRTGLTYNTTASAAATAGPPPTNPIINTVQVGNPFPKTGGGLQTFCDHVGQTSCTAALSPFHVEANYRTPYLSEWSIGVQQQLTKTIVFESTYFGSKGTKLPTSRNLNQINPATWTKTTAPTQADRPFKEFISVSSVDTNNNSNFHSWQNSLKQSYSNGVTFIIAYTFSKSTDGNGGVGSSSNSSGSPQNIFNIAAEHGLSDSNVKHRLIISPVAELPFGKGKAYLNHGIASTIFGGFQISGIFQFQTGRPFTVTNSSTNNSGYYGGADRPNQIGDPNSGPGIHTVAKWFNTAAFVSAPKFSATTIGQYGNAKRNNIIGPQLTSLDLTLSRNFPIFEKVHGQFRAEGFNVLNHPNFFNPLTTGAQQPTNSANPYQVCSVPGQSGCSNFGAITQANDPRDLQFSLRILF